MLYIYILHIYKLAEVAVLKHQPKIRPHPFTYHHYYSVYMLLINWRQGDGVWWGGGWEMGGRGGDCLSSEGVERERGRERAGGEDGRREGGKGRDEGRGRGRDRLIDIQIDR